MSYDCWCPGEAEPSFARLSWSPQELEESFGIPEVKALEFLEEFGEEIADFAQEMGNYLLRSLLRQQGLIPQDPLDNMFWIREKKLLKEFREDKEITVILAQGSLPLDQIVSRSTLSRRDVLRTLGRLTRRGDVYEKANNVYELDTAVLHYARYLLPDLGKKLIRKVRKKRCPVSIDAVKKRTARKTLDNAAHNAERFVLLEALEIAGTLRVVATLGRVFLKHLPMDQLEIRLQLVKKSQLRAEGFSVCVGGKELKGWGLCLRTMAEHQVDREIKDASHRRIPGNVLRILMRSIRSTSSEEIADFVLSELERFRVVGRNVIETDFWCFLEREIPAGRREGLIRRAFSHAGRCYETGVYVQCCSCPTHALREASRR